MGMRLDAADTAIYYSEPCSFLARQQTEDRIVSVAKKAPLLYLFLSVRDSVDEDIHFVLSQKAYRSDLTLTRALREAMRCRRSKT